MTNNEYLNLKYCDTLTELENFCVMAGIQTEITRNPCETIVMLSRNGNSVTKNIQPHIAFSEEVIKQVKAMITYLLGGEPQVKPDQILVAARGSGKSQFVREYFKALTGYKDLAIENVIFNDPATIVFWTDGSKTVVKAENEPFDPEKGLAMAISKKFLGNKGNYFNVFKKWLPEYNFDWEHALNLFMEKQAYAVPVKDVKPDKVMPRDYIGPNKPEIKKTCSNCKHVKPFSNSICDKCHGYDKFEAKEEAER